MKGILNVNTERLLPQDFNFCNPIPANKKDTEKNKQIPIKIISKPSIADEPKLSFINVPIKNKNKKENI